MFFLPLLISSHGITTQGHVLFSCLTFLFVVLSLLSLFFSLEAKNLSKFTSSPRAFLYVFVPSIRIRTS